MERKIAKCVTDNFITGPVSADEFYRKTTVSDQDMDKAIVAKQGEVIALNDAIGEKAHIDALERMREDEMAYLNKYHGSLLKEAEDPEKYDYTKTKFEKSEIAKILIEERAALSILYTRLTNPNSTVDRTDPAFALDTSKLDHLIKRIIPILEPYIKDGHGFGYFKDDYAAGDLKPELVLIGMLRVATYNLAGIHAEISSDEDGEVLVDSIRSGYHMVMAMDCVQIYTEKTQKFTTYTWEDYINMVITELLFSNMCSSPAQ